MFRDIVKGFTKTSEEELYIKHLTTHDQVELEDIENSYFEKAKKRGVPTEEESLNELKKDGAWSKEDESFIDRQTIYVENLEGGKRGLILKSQIDKQEEIIKTARHELNTKLVEKAELIGATCEKYARQRVNDFYISRSFFKDEELEKPLYCEKEFEEISYNELSRLVGFHNEHLKIFSESNIQQLILEDFFFPYMSFSEDTMQFFGFPVCRLTHNQLKLIIFTRVFKSIFDNNDNIPEQIRKDPQGLMDFASSSKKGREELERHEDKGGASTIVGATKEDYEYMGVETEGPDKPISLNEAAKKKGGSLNMNDLMDLTGA